MSKKKTSNPVENLDPVTIVDQTTTKSDSKKGANLVEQTLNEENEIKSENSKSLVISRLREFVNDFNNDNAVNIEELKTALAGFPESVINAALKNAKKANNDSISVTEILDELAKPQNANLRNSIIAECGNDSIELSNIYENGKLLVYHSTNDNGKFDYSKVTATSKNGKEFIIPIYVEKATATRSNLVRAIANYSTKTSARKRIEELLNNERKGMKNFGNSAFALLCAGWTFSDCVNELTKAFANYSKMH